MSKSEVRKCLKCKSDLDKVKESDRETLERWEMTHYQYICRKCGYKQ